MCLADLLATTSIRVDLPLLLHQPASLQKALELPPDREVLRNCLFTEAKEGEEYNRIKGTHVERHSHCDAVECRLSLFRKLGDEAEIAVNSLPASVWLD